MSESALNARRHAQDLHIRDKDLATGRDIRALILQSWRNQQRPDVVQLIENAITTERQRIAEERYAVWYRRLLRKVRGR